MSFTSRTVLKFKDIFPNEDPKEINEYLEGISRDMLMKFGSFILGFSRNSKYEHPKTFLEMFFSKGNTAFVKEVFKSLLVFNKEAAYDMEDVSFPYIVSSLSFFEYVYDKEYGDNKPYSNEEVEIAVFKAYLCFNAINTSDRTAILNKSTEQFKEDAKKFIVAYCMSLQLNNSDFTNYDVYKVFVTQILKAWSFFEFLEGSGLADDLLHTFYKEYGVASYHQYIKGLLPLQIAVMAQKREAHTDIVVPDDKDMDKNVAFLEKFSITDKELLEDMDFRKMRSRPIYKVDKRKFRLTYPLFVLELIGNGLYFNMKSINDGLPKSKKVKDLYGMKTYQFAEKYLLHKLLKEYFGNRYFQRNGDQLDGEFDAAPDYYVRNGKRVFLFESKDILINAAVKQSSDFNVIDRELSLKLFKNEKDKPKAVLQLVNNIRKILTKTLQFDKGYNANNVIVHPILVVHNRIFNTAGLNQWVNFWFQEELEKLKQEGCKISNVKPLVITDIDTLIFNKDAFGSRKISLEEALLHYQNDFLNFSLEGKVFYSQEEVNQAIKDTLIPFGVYLDNRIEKMGLRAVPKEFEQLRKSLFNEDQSKTRE